MRSLRVALVALVVSACGCGGNDDRSSADLGAGLEDAMKDGHAPTSVLVYVRGSADLSPSDALEAPGDRRAFVYRALADHADRVQKPLVDWLTAEGARLRPFHIVNAVVVYDAPPGL